MKSQKKIYSTFIKKTVENSLKLDANSTSCMILHQPKAPAALKKFSKIENDK